MAVALATLTAPGDVVLCESVTYTGMRSLAHHLHVARARRRRWTTKGLIPDALEDAALETGGRVLYCMPTVQNPTARVMSRKRRQDIGARAPRASTCRSSKTTSTATSSRAGRRSCALAPERTFYLTSLSKCLVPGLRIGVLRAPPGWIDRVTGAVFATTVMGTPLDAAAAAAWIEDGTLDRVIAWKRQEIKARQQLARGVLGDPRHRIGRKPARLAAAAAALAGRRLRARSATARRDRHRRTRVRGRASRTAERRAHLPRTAVGTPVAASARSRRSPTFSTTRRKRSGRPSEVLAASTVYGDRSTAAIRR